MRAGRNSKLGRFGQLRQPTRVNNNLILWIYIVLLIVGGLIGFLRAKSRISLIMSAIFAALLILTTFPNVMQRSTANNVVNGIMVFLLVVFAIRLAKTKKFIPSGLMLLVTIAALVLRNVKF